jgi:hypothetical protein
MSEEQDLMAVINWLAGDDRGLSSENIACHMVGLHERVSGFTPSDPDDLGRCLRLLERFPEWKSHIGEMTQYGKEWAALVPHWDELAQMMADEVGIDWSKGKRAPLTYKAMHSYAYEARRATHD